MISIALKLNCKILTMTFGFYLLLLSPTPATTSLLYSFHSDHTEPLVSPLNALFPVPELHMYHSRMLCPWLPSWLIYSLPSPPGRVFTGQLTDEASHTAPFYPILLVVLSQQLCQSVIILFNGLLVFYLCPHSSTGSMKAGTTSALSTTITYCFTQCQPHSQKPINIRGMKKWTQSNPITHLE